MARLNEDAQWIILLGFIISVSIFLLAIIVNESVMVGQTTAESVLDLPKTDIHDLRDEVITSSLMRGLPPDQVKDIEIISLANKSALVNISAPVAVPEPHHTISIHYNNGVTSYNETTYF